MKPTRHKAEDLGLETQKIDPDALFVVEELEKAGYTAYIVGGCVRDLLIGRSPKDYDVSTSARPEEVKRIFRRRCLLIGRRFRLAHIRFGHKIIEVSTFRTGKNEEDDLIVHDNEWGSEEDDVLRRDFTINGLFYAPLQNEVIDYVGGWEDLQSKTLRTIGTPDIRFRQDPVRMIRLLKFRARLGFIIDEGAKKALICTRHELIKSAPARILEEMYRMLESGASAPFFHLMEASGLLKLIFPRLAPFLAHPKGQSVYALLETADKIHRESGEHKLDRATLTSCLLFPMLEDVVAREYLSQDIVPNLGDIMVLSSSLMNEVLTSSFSRFPRKISASTVFIINMQYRLTPLKGNVQLRPKLYQNYDFLPALQFFKIRALRDSKLHDLYEYWKEDYAKKAPVRRSRAHRRGFGR